jgi:HisA/HisF family protein
MDIIPVIDVRHGVAVRAAGGRRESYRPLQSPLAAGSDPIAVAQGLMSLRAFSTLYLADLDGIEGRGVTPALLEKLSAVLPGTGLWVDAGEDLSEVAAKAGTGGSSVPVLGTESMQDITDVSALAALPRDGLVLSLDFKDDCFEGPHEVFGDSTLWPDRVIVMTLARVGSEAGPDLERIADIVRRAQGRRVYAAGGIRNVADIVALSAAGAAGALVATALHSGKITAGDLKKIAGR